MNILDTTRRATIVRSLVEGNSVRATCRMTGTAKGAVLKLVADLGAACVEYHDAHVRNVTAKHVQCDEIWSFVGAKAKNVQPRRSASTATLGRGRRSTPIRSCASPTWLGKLADRAWTIEDLVALLPGGGSK
jgi:hypothetical protein